ncbi:MAG: flavodoxin family protein [Atopobiaceae bacterium]|nr:flavodoxin family protein [Atopobiaceae bacterium]
MSKVVVLEGSPKKGGNTDLMAEAFAQAAEAAGHDVKVIPVGRMNIDGCRGCRACYKAGKPCVFGDQDEWNGIAPGILAADAIAFATPVYWFGWTAQAKAVLDRMFCFQPKGEEFQGKKAAFFSAAADGEDVFEAPKMVFEKSAALNGWEVIGEVCAASCGAHGSVRETDYLAQAAKVAERL